MKTFLKNKFTVIVSALLICLCIVFVACRNIPSDDPADEQLLLNSTKVSLGEEQTFQLSVTGADEDAAVEFSSNNVSVATVSSNGLITAVAAGNATVKCVSGEKYALCAVVVSAYKPTGLLSLYVQSELNLYTGDTFTLSVALKSGSDSVVADSLTFASSASGLVSVDEQGVVSAKASGKATITTTATYNDEEISAITEVSVSMPQYTLVKSFVETTLLKGETLNLDVGVFRGSQKIENISDLTYFVDNSDVATIENGVLSAKEKGTVNISVSCLVYEQTLSLEFSLTVREKYSVAFISDGATLLQTEVLDGESVQAPTPSAPKDKTFAGWFVDNVETSSENIQQDSTFVAHWIVSGVYYNQNASQSEIFSYTGKSDVKSNITMFSDNAWLSGIMKAQPQDLQGDYTLILPEINYSSYNEVFFTVSYNYGGINISAEGATAVSSMETNKAYTFSFVTKNGSTTLFVDGDEKTLLSEEVADGTRGLTLTFSVPTDGSQPYAELTFSKFYIYNLDYNLAMTQIVEALPTITAQNAVEYSSQLEEYLQLKEYLTDYERSVYVEPLQITLLRQYLE